MTQNLSSYRIFYSVAECGNISKAASELYISQPAISKSIRKLEDSLGVTLFVRSSRGVTLTEEGKLLFEHVKSAFEMLQSGEDKLLRNLELGVGHLKIGVSSTLCKYMLVPYLKHFIQENPHINISITCQSTNHTLKLLENNKIDLGLIGKPVVLHDIDFTYLAEIEDIFVASPSYIENLKIRGVGQDTILTSSMLMLLDKENMTRKYIDDYLEENNIHVQDMIEISSMDLLIEFARIGLGVACVIRSFVQEDLDAGTLVEIPLEIPIHTREVGFAYRNSTSHSKSLEKFVNFYKQSAR
jgi:DNA-binding transcriptional LysR family regulator